VWYVHEGRWRATMLRSCQSAPWSIWNERWRYRAFVNALGFEGSTSFATRGSFATSRRATSNASCVAASYLALSESGGTLAGTGAIGDSTLTVRGTHNETTVSSLELTFAGTTPSPSAWTRFCRRP
jgi:hypothetical protein